MEMNMKRRRKIYQTLFISTITVLGLMGCDDSVRQTVAPYLFTGLQTIAAGFVAGLEQQVYPKGSTSTAQTVTTPTPTPIPTPTP
jgi:hypothetical protein